MEVSIDWSKLSPDQYLRKWQILCSNRSGLKADLSVEELDAHRNLLLQDDELVIQLMHKHGLKGRDEVKKIFDHPEGADDCHIQWMARQLLRCVLASDRSRLQDVPVGMLPTNDFNAHAIKSPSGEPIIVLRTGTVGLLHNAVVSFVKTIPTPTSAPVWTKEQGAFWCLQWLGAYAFQKPVFGLEKMPPLRDPARIAHSGTLVDMALAFILGHEFGHLLLGHLKKSKIVQRSLVPDSGAPPVDFYAKDQQQEYDADVKGIELAIEFCKKHSNGSFQIVFLAVEMVYRLLHVLELLRPTDARTHPPAGLRRAAFEKRNGDVFDSEIKGEIAYLDEVFGVMEEMAKRVLADPASLGARGTGAHHRERLGLDGSDHERQLWREQLMRCLDALREQDYPTAALALADAFENHAPIFEPDVDVVRRELVRGRSDAKQTSGGRSWVATEIGATSSGSSNPRRAGRSLSCRSCRRVARFH